MLNESFLVPFTLESFKDFIKKADAELTSAKMEKYGIAGECRDLTTKNMTCSKETGTGVKARALGLRHRKARKCMNLASADCAIDTLLEKGNLKFSGVKSIFKAKILEKMMN
jgi:hypothetical protein